MSSRIRAAQQRGDFASGEDGDWRVYLDYTGAAVPPKHLIREHARMLLSSHWGNPHSTHRSSKETSDRIECVRELILRRCNGGGEYDVIFTESASDGLQILANCYPWNDNTAIILSRSNHNSVNGLREPVRAAGGTMELWDTDEELRLKPVLTELIDRHRKRYSDIVVAFPAQSNLSGVVHTPERFVREAKNKGATVVLDTAAYAPTKPIDLIKLGEPDAIAVSFYKIFGYPTGIGALVIRKKLLQALRHPSFAGGTINIVHPFEGHVMAPGHTAHEYGTINYQAIPAIKNGFEYLDTKLGGVQAVGDHVQALTADALKRLTAINGVRIYGPRDMHDRGGTIAFNILDRDGHPLPPHVVVEKASTRARIEMREGCHCNPGDVSRGLGLSFDDMADLVEAVKRGDAKAVERFGVVRASFGYGTEPEHIDALVNFVEETADHASGKRSKRMRVMLAHRDFPFISLFPRS